MHINIFSVKTVERPTRVHPFLRWVLAFFTSRFVPEYDGRYVYKIKGKFDNPEHFDTMYPGIIVKIKDAYFSVIEINELNKVIKFYSHGGTDLSLIFEIQEKITVPGRNCMNLNFNDQKT